MQPHLKIIVKIKYRKIVQVRNIIKHALQATKCVCVIWAYYRHITLNNIHVLHNKLFQKPHITEMEKK